MKPPGPEVEFLSADAVAQRFGLPVSTIRRLARQGQIPGRRVGGLWRFRSSELEAWWAAR